MDSCVETLLELLQTYRAKPGDRVADKSASIFTRTCCLLAVLLKMASRASVSPDYSARVWVSPGCCLKSGLGGQGWASGLTGGGRCGRRCGRWSRQETVRPQALQPWAREEAQSRDLAAERNRYWLNVCLFTQYRLSARFLHICPLYNRLTD